MQTQQDLKKKIENTEDLEAVVKTMKVLAAVSIRQFQRAVESLSDYRRTVDMGFQILLRQRPHVLSEIGSAQDGGVGAVVFGSHQGMCGQFNEQLADFIVQKMQDLGAGGDQRRVLAIGERIISRLENRGQNVDAALVAADSVVGIVPLLREVVIRIERWRSEHRLGRMVVFNNQPTSGSSYRPRMVQLLPLDREWFRSLQGQDWPSVCFPNYKGHWPDVFSSLVRQFFFVVLYRGAAESLASENAARLAAMQVAEKNIDERLDELTAQYNHQRQSSITAELLDIVSGFEALVD